MPRNLFIAVILSTCLQLTALARTPRVVSLQKLPQAVELQQFYSSLHKVLGKQSLRNKEKKYGINLKPLQEFLKGKSLAPKVREELENSSEKYAEILGNEVDIADLLKYSKLQALAEGASSSDTQANDYIELVDSVIKDLPVKAKLYLFTIKLTLADGTEVILIKPGMSMPHNIKNRVEEQINSLEKIAFDPSGVTFNIRDQSLNVVESSAVVEMKVEQVNLVDGRQKYLDLNYGVTDTDVHRQLVDNGYQMVHGIPNIKGGERKEVFSKVNKNGEYENSNHADDVVTALEQANDQTYLERQAKTNGLNGNGVSLSLPTKQQVEFIFAVIEFRAKAFETEARLAKMLLEIKWYEHKTSDMDVAQELRSKFDDKFNNYTDDEVKVKIEHLSEEVFLMRKIITAIQKKGENPSVVGRKLGLGSGYSYTSHLNKEFDTVALVVMGFIIDNEYPKYQDLGALFGDLLDLRGERKEVNAAMQLLRGGIKKAGGWLALQSAMRTGDPSSAGKFRNDLVDAALRGEAAEHIAEVVLLYIIISAIQAVEGEDPRVVGSKLGLGWRYGYESHLNKEFDTVALVVMGITINNEYPEHEHEHQTLHALFGDLLDLRGERKEVKDPVQLLQKGINKAGEWQALRSAMKEAAANAAAQLINNLARAAIDGVAAKQIEVTEKRMAEVVLLHRIISAIKKKGEEVKAVASKLGLDKYSYTSHLEKGRVFDLQVLKESVEAIKQQEIKALKEQETDVSEEQRNEMKNKHENLDDSIERLNKVYNPLQQFRLTFLNIIKQKRKKQSMSETDTEAVIELLLKSIGGIEGWLALQSAMRTGEPNAAAKLRFALADAALRGETAERIAEVVLLYRIISAIQKKGGGKINVVGRKLGLGEYSYTSHLQEGQVFDLDKLQKKIYALKDEYKNNATITNSIKLLQQLREPKQLALPFSP